MFAPYKVLNIIFSDASKNNKMEQYAVSVIISFYNKIEYLKRIFAALERQTFPNFEVIIADDGSTADVVEEIRRIQAGSAIAIQHVWHEDLGFRKTKILN